MSPDPLTLLRRIVSGEIEQVPDPVPSACIEVWRNEGVDLLAWHHLGALRSRLGRADLDGLAAAVQQACARELARQSLIRETLDTVRAAGIRTLVLKGTSLAYALYPDPWLRPRLDCDLLVHPRDEAAVASAINARGGRELPSVPGLTGQRSFRIGRIGEVIDLHTRLAAPVAFRTLDRFDALWSRSRPLPALGPAARWLGPPDALLHACVHRVAHHNDSTAALWLYDIHLLARRLGTDGWNRFTAAAARTGTRAICGSGLRAAHDRFGTPVPEQASPLLHGRFDEPTATFLGGRLSEARLQRLNVVHLGTWRERLEFARRHLFPPRAYIRWRYNVSRPGLLLFLYVWRIVAGAPRWLKRR